MLSAKASQVIDLANGATVSALIESSRSFTNQPSRPKFLLLEGATRSIANRNKRSELQTFSVWGSFSAPGWKPEAGESRNHHLASDFSLPTGLTAANHVVGGPNGKATCEMSPANEHLLEDVAAIRRPDGRRRYSSVWTIRRKNHRGEFPHAMRAGAYYVTGAELYALARLLPAPR